LGLLDGDAGPQPSKIPRNVATGAAAVLAVAVALTFALRYHSEKSTARRFLQEVVAGDFPQAYRTWKPAASYSLDDFVRDWGPNGVYGPVKSYELVEARRPTNGSGVVVTVEVSPYTPFPDQSDAKSRDTKQIRLWVESSDQSMSYAPTEFHIKR
jgi:hypothetical protein